MIQTIKIVYALIPSVSHVIVVIQHQMLIMVSKMNVAIVLQCLKLLN